VSLRQRIARLERPRTRRWDDGPVSDEHRRLEAEAIRRRQYRDALVQFTAYLWTVAGDEHPAETVTAWNVGGQLRDALHTLSPDTREQLRRAFQQVRRAIGAESARH
jgi:hypothetical protein